MTSLTPRQRACLDFIERYESARGYAPTVDEIRAALGLVSKSGAHRLLIALESRGRLLRLPRRARAMLVLRDGCGDDEDRPMILEALGAAVLARLALIPPGNIRFFPSCHVTCFANQALGTRQKATRGDEMLPGGDTMLPNETKRDGR